MKKKNFWHPGNLSQIALMVAFLSVCAWITVPTPVPFTLQTFGIFFAVGILGGKKGTACIFVYLLLGLVGAPVFSGFSGGIGHFMGNTGGFLIGFFLAALTFWCLEILFAKKIMLFSMILGLVLCYLVGTVWFMFLTNMEQGGFFSFLAIHVLPLLIPDIFKVSLAYFLCKRVKILRS